MKNKLFTLLLAVIAIFSLVACVDTGTTNKPTNPENGEETQNPTESETKENSVKIKSIDAQETSDVQATYAKAKMRQSRNSGDDTNNSVDEFNYIIITRPQTDITFTITLDNPEAYGIDALRVYCDDENAQIQVDGEYKPIAQESDGTRVVNWSSEDPYTKTYNIRTTSEDAINSFKVVDVRLAGHDKFQSKETNSTDLGNNELHIYKMDEDAYTLNVIENTFDYIKFNFNVKDEYKDIISNIKVDGLEMDEELGYWMLEESRDVSITYDYYLEEYDIKVSREDVERITLPYILDFAFDELSSLNIIDNIGYTLSITVYSLAKPTATITYHGNELELESIAGEKDWLNLTQYSFIIPFETFPERDTSITEKDYIDNWASSIEEFKIEINSSIKYNVKILGLREFYGIEFVAVELTEMEE